MIYMEPKSLGYDPLMISWFTTLPKAVDANMKTQLMVGKDENEEKKKKKESKAFFEQRPSS